MGVRVALWTWPPFIDFFFHSSYLVLETSKSAMAVIEAIWWPSSLSLH